MQQYGKFNGRAHGKFLFVECCKCTVLEKQTSPPQILEANHKYTVPVKGPPQMRKNLWHCISERNPLQRNFRSHMAEAHARKCSGDSSQCRNSDEQIGRTCEYKHAVAVYFCRAVSA